MIPQSLRDTPQWLVSGEDKVPVSPKTGRFADVRDRSLYASYDEAVAFASAKSMDVGFALTPEDPFTVIDLDATENPEQQERHRKIYEAFPTYAELSRSGGGVHIWCRGSVPRGVRRDKVEVYAAERYMICTGRALRPAPIVDCQETLNILFEEISRSQFGEVELVEHDALMDDEQVFQMASRAANADKFDQLCRGEWQGEYPSQSEADFALMNMFCYYSRSNEQAKRLFRYSALGKREKAQRDAYLDRMIRKIRSEETPPIDFSAIQPNGNGSGPKMAVDRAKNGAVPVPPVNPPVQVPDPDLKSRETVDSEGTIGYPPGFMGEIARYIVESSIRPVKEVGITAALALCAGIVGRQYNISGTGLNQYLILLAKTGAGKEGGPSGIERILKATRTTAPVVDGFVGPGTFASGQAIIRTLDERPCFFSILGEFGLTLQMLSETNVSGHMLVMRRVLLDLYTKSGQSSVLYSSAYSDKEKNTKTLFAPAMTLFGESTPETFYAGLSLQHIADGLVPRFLIIEYDGERPQRNENAFWDPPAQLIARFTDLIEIALRMQSNQSWEQVTVSEEADRLLAKFDSECDAHIRSGGNEGIRQLWNRAHLKALRLAALLAVVDRPHVPVISAEEAAWAVSIVRRDAVSMSARFERGDVGEGDSKQLADMQRVLSDYVERDTEDIVKSYAIDGRLHARRIVQKRYIQRRVAALAAFRKDRRGAVRAMNDTIQELVSSGYLQKVPLQQLQSDDIGFKSNEDCWFIREL